MAKISTYTNAGTPTLDDKLIGTEIGATPTDATKNSRNRKRGVGIITRVS